MEKCAFCAEENEDDAIVCKHCGRDLMKKKFLTRLSEKGVIISMLISLLAAFAAARSAYTSSHSVGITVHSADTADRALKHAQEIWRTELQRDVNASIQSIIAESQEIDDLAERLKLGYRDSARFSGRSGSDTERLLKEKVEKHRAEIAPIRKKALKYSEDKKLLRALSDDELAYLLGEFEANLNQVRRIKKELGDLSSVERQNQIHMEKLFKNF